MISAGYCLTFGTKSQDSTVWFNFKRDILYLPVFEWDYTVVRGLYHVVRPKWALERFLEEDAKKVRNLAVTGNVSRMVQSIISPVAGFVPALEVFKNAEELLLVETIQGEHTSIPRTRRFKDERDDPFGYVECDVAEAQDKCPPEGNTLSVDYRYLIEDYRTQKYSDGRDFFQHLLKRFEHDLVELQKKSIAEEAKEWTVPRVKSVQIMSRHHAARLLCNRRRYWAEVEEERKIQFELKIQLSGSFPSK